MLRTILGLRTPKKRHSTTDGVVLESAALIDQYRKLHSEKSDYGRSSERLFQHIQPLVDELPIVRSIIDYGCGRSHLVDWLGRCISSDAALYALLSHGGLSISSTDASIQASLRPMLS